MFSGIIKSDKPVLVDFFATWGSPYEAIIPILTDLNQKLGNSTIIIKVDIGRNQHGAN